MWQEIFLHIFDIESYTTRVLQSVVPIIVPNIYFESSEAKKPRKNIMFEVSSLAENINGDHILLIAFFE